MIIHTFLVVVIEDSDDSSSYPHLLVCMAIYQKSQ